MAAETLDVLKAEVKVLNKHGLHMRCCGELTRLAMGFKSTIKLTNGQRTAEAKSMLGLATLAAGPGCILKVVVSGPDATAALSAVTEYFAQDTE